MQKAGDLPKKTSQYDVSTKIFIIGVLYFQKIVDGFC